MLHWLALPLLAHPSFNLPHDDVATGPSVARLIGDDAWAYGFDTSITEGFFSLSVNARLLDESDGLSYGAQAEATLWFFANWGGGAGYLAGEREGWTLHLFTGFPMGDDFRAGPFRSLYVEPFYRLNFVFEDPGTARLHELGLLVKVTTFAI